MKGATKFIVYVVLILVLAVGGILLVQIYSVPEDNEKWIPDETEKEQQESTNVDSISNKVATPFD